jgi:hypothetical protein
MEDRHMDNTRLFFVWAAIAVASLVIMVGATFAEDEKPMKPNAMKVTVKGQNYCLACSLKNQGAMGTCKAEGCRHALKVTEAMDADGNPIPEMKGWTLHYLHNEHGKKLGESHTYHGKDLCIEGTVYRAERVVEVAGMEVEKPKMSGPVRHYGGS